MLRYTTPRNVKDELNGEGSREGQDAKASALHADHLLDLSDDFNQIFLVLHHRLDRFVSAGNFVQYAYVFATLNTRSLTSEVVLREGSLRCSA